MTPLVLSLFPGIGLLDMAFEAEGFCVVRGPDLLWGGDVRRFHVPAGRFDGVIGGPPCQLYSAFRHINPSVGRHGDLIPEFERVVGAAQPTWFLMENVEAARLPSIGGFHLHAQLVRDDWCGGATSRLRRFSFGWRSNLHIGRFHIETLALHTAEPLPAVTSAHEGTPVRLNSGGKIKRTADRPHLSFADACERQGLPRDFLSDCPLTAEGRRRVIGNGVPLPMGRAVAKAVKRAMHPELAGESATAPECPVCHGLGVTYDAGTGHRDLCDRCTDGAA